MAGGVGAGKEGHVILGLAKIGMGWNHYEGAPFGDGFALGVCKIHRISELQVQDGHLSEGRLCRLGFRITAISPP